MSAPELNLTLPPTSDELRGFVHTAVRAARAAAQLHQANVGRDLGIGTKSSDTDLVTRVDRESEARIREVLLGAYPEHVVLGEEGGQQGESRHRWIVDPLDGTLNYAHGFPFYCVSIGLEVDGAVQVGVVLDSFRGELFTAVRGGGAYLNGAPIAVSEEAVLRRCMLATGFSSDAAEAAHDLAVFGRMMAAARSIRRPGASALDLAYVACGRLDGFWQVKLHPWDVAAGVLLVSEAGGAVSGPAGAPYRLGEPLVAANARVHGALLAALDSAQA